MTNRWLYLIRMELEMWMMIGMIGMIGWNENNLWEILGMNDEWDESQYMNNFAGFDNKMVINLWFLMYVDVVDKAEAFLMTRFLISYEIDPRTEREVNTTAPPKVTEGQGVTTDWEWGDNYGPLDPQTERGSDTTAPPKVAEGQGVTTDWEWVASTSPLNDIPIGLI